VFGVCGTWPASAIGFIIGAGQRLSAQTAAGPSPGTSATALNPRALGRRAGLVALALNLGLLLPVRRRRRDREKLLGQALADPRSSPVVTFLVNRALGRFRMHHAAGSRPPTSRAAKWRPWQPAAARAVAAARAGAGRRGRGGRRRGPLAKKTASSDKPRGGSAPPPSDQRGLEPSSQAGRSSQPGFSGFRRHPTGRGSTRFVLRSLLLKRSSNAQQGSPPAAAAELKYVVPHLAAQACLPSPARCKRAARVAAG